jgi:hypothetical protein
MRSPLGRWIEEGGLEMTRSTWLSAVLASLTLFALQADAQLVCCLCQECEGISAACGNISPGHGGAGATAAMPCADHCTSQKCAQSTELGTDLSNDQCFQACERRLAEERAFPVQAPASSAPSLAAVVGILIAFELWYLARRRSRRRSPRSGIA